MKMKQERADKSLESERDSLIITGINLFCGFESSDQIAMVNYDVFDAVTSLRLLASL